MKFGGKREGTRPFSPTVRRFNEAADEVRRKAPRLVALRVRTEGFNEAADEVRRKAPETVPTTGRESSGFNEAADEVRRKAATATTQPNAAALLQ